MNESVHEHTAKHVPDPPKGQGQMETKKCPFCSEEINVDAKKCKHCRECLEQPPTKQEGTPIRKVPYWKALLVCIFGGIGVMGFGLLLSMIVIGMIVGIPLMIGGAFMVIGSPVLAFYILEGDCPYCGYRLTIPPPKKATKCRQCKQRSVVRDMRLMPLKAFIQMSK